MFSQQTSEGLAAVVVSLGLRGSLSPFTPLTTIYTIILCSLSSFDSMNCSLDLEKILSNLMRSVHQILDGPERP